MTHLAHAAGMDVEIKVTFNNGDQYLCKGMIKNIAMQPRDDYWDYELLDMSCLIVDAKTVGSTKISKKVNPPF